MRPSARCKYETLIEFTCQFTGVYFYNNPKPQSETEGLKLEDVGIINCHLLPALTNRYDVNLIRFRKHSATGRTGHYRKQIGVVTGRDDSTPEQQTLRVKWLKCDY